MEQCNPNAYHELILEPLLQVKGYTIGGYAKVDETDVYLTKNEEYTIPEFPSFLILPLLTIATLMAAVADERNRFT